ncbi:uncharacterized protein [Nicotiana sylvestris]|uniref:Vesicle transport protein n=2 Tax=Nicotiana TaxID=4085 RepID=A0A1S3Z9W0_TOBAC|nr:PREDICTED: uncharacterized protein LOC104246511 [Nicotiana sylvestris]XP_016461149.1 PREDICTED: uncharacterized protein LOC107784519 [Nicotiana tabacum]
MMRRQQDQQSKVFYELSSLILNIIRSPPGPIEFPDDSLTVSPSTSGRRTAVAGSMQHITPAGFASLLLGISFALMLCGSVTFFIGFLMMPWVLGLVMVFYVAGIVYSLSMIGRAIFCHISSPPSPRKDFQPWKLF